MFPQLYNPTNVGTQNCGNTKPTPTGRGGGGTLQYKSSSLNYDNYKTYSLSKHNIVKKMPHVNGEGTTKTLSIVSSLLFHFTSVDTIFATHTL